ncbi:MAG: hypothetical protein IKR45_06390, partial [Treponema sp.]|nr:hypothetical protein [Treponema sp.]
GDEFSAIAIGMKLSQENKFREKISSLCKMISDDRNFPFTLSMSIGAVEFELTNEKPTKLTALLSQADDKLYIEKKEKHKKKS